MKILALLVVVVALSNASPLVFDPKYKAPFPIQFYFDVAAKQPTKNLVVSPSSVTTCLALAYMGASGKTSQVFHDVLNFSGSTQREIAQHFGGFVSAVNSKANSNLAFTMANRIFVDKQYELNPAYTQLATEFLYAEPETLDFSKNAVASDKVNSWVAHQTHDKIKGVVSPSDFNSSTGAVLVNAVYFKAPWRHPFKEYSTRKEDFYLNKNDKIKVDMMHDTGRYEVADWSHIDATAIRIPYADSDIYMLIVLPKTIDGLKEMEAKFKTVNHAYLQTTPTYQKIELFLPKFKFEFDTSLVEVLKEMGLENIFTDEADFSNLLNTKKPIKISEVKHKAFIEIDENGTEASAATAVIAMVASSLGTLEPDPIRIKVDHPFMFAIRDKNNVYFAGHVVNFE